MPNRRIRLCQLTPSLWSGGTEERIARITQGLHRSEFDLSWLGFGPAREALTERAGPDVEILPVARHADEGIEPSLIPRLARTLKRLKPDILHVHNWSTSLYGIAAARLAGVPAVIFGLGGQNSPEEAPPQRRAVMRALSPHVDVFTAVCEFLGQQFEADWGAPREKIRVLKTGIDLSVVDAAPEPAVVRASLGLPEDAVVCGAISVFRPVKCLPDMIDAVAAAAADDPRIHLLLIGNPLGVSNESLLAQAHQAGLGSRFHLHGRVEHPADWLPAFDVFMNTSSFEGASNAIIEAMAARIPVIATRVGGTPELIDDGEDGLLADMNDVPALTAAVRRLAADPELRRRIGAAARTRVERDHTYAAMTQAYVELYRQMAALARSQHHRASRDLWTSAQLLAAVGQAGVWSRVRARGL